MSMNGQVLLADEDGRPIKTQAEYQAEGRERIAGQITRYVRRLRIPADRVAGWTESQWLEAAKGAGVQSAIRRGKVPSPETRAVTISFIRDWEEATS